MNQHNPNAHAQKEKAINDRKHIKVKITKDIFK